MTSIFVAKLDFGVTSDDLKKAFEEFGSVIKASVATDRETGKSRGFGFVEMTNQEEAMNAINALDGSTMSGRQIAVKEAEQRPDNRAPRDNTRPRENSRPFQPRTDQSFKPRENTSPRISLDDDEPTGFVPKIDSAPLKSEPRKKVIGKEKEKKKPQDLDDRSKKTKLSPYKKSGKIERFMDDDDDFDPESASLFDFDDEEGDWENYQKNNENSEEDEEDFDEED